jgi:uncharacterized membrane protein YphA (DoxX/SURF4 family)
MTTQKNTKGLNILLWIAQVILCGMFLMAGTMKLITPDDDMMKNMPDATEGFLKFIRFVGVCEVLGGIGMILPSLLKIKPILTPIAAIGIAITMIVAVGIHISKGETSATITTVVLALLAIFVIWGRFKAAPIAAR